MCLGICKQFSLHNTNENSSTEVLSEKSYKYADRTCRIFVRPVLVISRFLLHTNEIYCFLPETKTLQFGEFPSIQVSDYVHISSKQSQ